MLRPTSLYICKRFLHDILQARLKFIFQLPYGSLDPFSFLFLSNKSYCFSRIRIDTDYKTIGQY